MQEIYPLAPLQEGLLYHHFTDARDPYQQHALFAFTGHAELLAFSQALEQVIARHDILRTSLAWDGLEQPQQVVWRQARLPLTVLEPGQGDAVALLRGRETTLDLRQAPMLALAAVEDRANGRWLGMLHFHHLVNDAVSVQVLLAELEALMTGQGHALGAPVAYRNYVAVSRAPERQAGHERFFKALLAGVEAPAKLAGMGEALDTQVLESAAMAVPEPLAKALRRLGRAHDVGLGSLFHLAWALVLGALGA